uniref:Putative secreted protein n=1 Tax=Ixodes ricinus TaxID=34613 RepID=A0A6B0UC94_IXORI
MELAMGDVVSIFVRGLAVTIVADDACCMEVGMTGIFVPATCANDLMLEMTGVPAGVSAAGLLPMVEVLTVGEVVVRVGRLVNWFWNARTHL